MKIKLHHLNLCSKDVTGMEAFYRSVLDLAPEPSLNGTRDTTQGYAAPVSFVTDGQTQVHLDTSGSAFAPTTSSIRWSGATSRSAPMILPRSSSGSRRRTSRIQITGSGR